MRVLNITYTSYAISNDEAHQEAVDWISGLGTTEIDVEEETFKRKDHDYVDTVNGIDVWYNWRADYYVFTEEEVRDE